MRPKKNSFEFVELARMSGKSEEQTPYKLWSGDLWECQDCGIEIIYTDHRQSPIAEHYEGTFQVRAAKVTVRAKEWSRA
jgi:hypothetical protein